MPKIGNPLVQFTAFRTRVKAFVRGLPARLWVWTRARTVEDLAQIVNVACIAVALLWFAGLLIAHIKFIAQPGPQEFNEPAIWHTTWLLFHHRNPYSIQELPGSAYCFGPLYNYIVIALEPIIGLDYPAHRLVALAFLLGSMWVMMRAMQKAGSGLGIALLSVVFYHWMSMSNIEITARPDTLGLYFFLLGILIPWWRDYSLGSTIVGLLCAVVACNFKSYFVVAGCATLMTHFLVRDKRAACWLGVGFFALVAATFLLSCYLYPYFYIETVIVQRGGAIVNDRDDISIMHTTMLFERGWPFMAAMALGLAGWLWRRHLARRAPGNNRKFTHDDWRFLSLGTVFVIFLTLVYFYMGRNAGAYFTYHLHLLFPLMFILAAYALRPVWYRIVFGLLLIMFFRSWVTVPDVPDSTVPFRRMERLVYDTHSEILGIACLTDVFERDSRRVLHNGNTMFMGFAFADNRAEHDAKIGALAKRFEETEAEVRTKVEARTYALIFTEFDEPYFCSTELLKKYYDKVEQIDYYTYFGHSPVRVWKPKPKLAGAKTPP